MSDNGWREEDELAPKYIFVTGGVVSSLGKGLAAASVGALLEARGLRVTLQKMDPYINVDAGTMSPNQHGEVFVTDDGGEDRKSTRLNSSHGYISYAVFCLKKKKTNNKRNKKNTNSEHHT